MENNILESAEIIQITPESVAQKDEAIKYNSLGLDFAEPEVVTSMMYDLGIDPVKVDSGTAEKMKSIYEMSKRQSLPLGEYLVENGRKIGGKLTPDFLGKLFVYLSAVDRENSLRRDLAFASKERELYENRNRL